MISRFISSFIIIVTLFSFNNVKAGHFADMEIFYRWVSDSTYEFTATYNRNCSGVGVAAPNTVSIQVLSSSNSFSSFFICTKLPTTGPGVPPLVIPNLFNCINNSTFCTEEHVYRGTWTSPFKADDWRFSFSTCCMPAGPLAPNNVVANTTLYTDCGLNNLDFPDGLNKNNSPFWHNMRPNHPSHPGDTLNNPPHISFCAARPQNLDQSTKNYDGDVIKYKFIASQQSPFTPIAYANGWSLSNLMPSTTGPLTIDSLTGAINFTPGAPTGTGVYLITIQATEYRNDTIMVGPVQQVVEKEIGYVQRNLFVYLNDSATCPGGSLSYSDTTGMASSQRIFDCPEQSFEIRFTDEFMCSSLDTSGSDILLRHPATNTIIPIKSAISSGCNSAQTSDRFIVTIDTVLQADTFELMIKVGNDLNTLVTQCQFELEPFADTLQLIFLEQEIGELLGDKLGPNNFNTLIEIECGDSNFVVNLSEKVLCSSVASDGSDFELYNTITKVVLPIKSIGKNCNGVSTQKLNLNTSPIDPGNYFLRLKRGSDSDRLTNVCSSEWTVDSILVVSSGLFPNLGMDTARCEDDTAFLYFLNPGQFNTYNWSTGVNGPSIFINVPSTYWVEVANQYGCKAIDSMTLSIKDCYVGINSLDENDFEIYPNPATTVIYIKSNEKINGNRVQVYNLIGEKMDLSIKQNNSILELDISEVVRGIYFVKIDIGNGKFVTKKVVVVN